MLKFFDIESINDIAANPRFHFYYQGVKFYLIDHELVRRLIRGKERDYADIIAIYNLNKELIINYFDIDYKNAKIILKSNIFKQRKLDYKTIYSYFSSEYKRIMNVDESVFKTFFETFKICSDTCNAI